MPPISYYIWGLILVIDLAAFYFGFSLFVRGELPKKQNTRTRHLKLVYKKEGESEKEPATHSPNWCPSCTKETDWLIIPDELGFVQCKDCGHVKRVPMGHEKDI